MCVFALRFVRSCVQKNVFAVSGATHSGKGSALARVGGSAIAGVCELLLFHPVDTVAKRLMSYQVHSAAAHTRVCMRVYVFVSSCVCLAFVYAYICLRACVSAHPLDRANCPLLRMATQPPLQSSTLSSSRTQQIEA
jgi:hypothetical protein